MSEFTPDFGQMMSNIEGECAEDFRIFRELLLSYNQKFNLTTLTDEREITVKHFLDSISGESLFPRDALAAEVGSGAGFPSIPLKLMRRDISFTLFEATGKKCDFLRLVSQRLDLSLNVHHLRAEEAGRAEQFREKFDVCCARAVARLNTLAEYCLPLVKVGGRFLAYKGPCGEELEEAENAILLLGGKIEKVLSFSLPEDFGERSIVVLKKIKPTPAKYPRGRGKERSEPLL